MRLSSLLINGFDFIDGRKSMKKINSLLFCLCFLVLSATAASAQRQTKSPTSNDDWVGEYEYTYTEGKTAGGAVPVIEYRIVVSAKGDSLAARFTADGYQSNSNYSCTAKAAGNQLNIYFLKDLNDTDTEERTGRLRKGQPVGSLVRTTVRGRTRYIFRDKIFFNPKYPPTFKKG